METLSMAAYEFIQPSQHNGVGLVRFHRPKALNALCPEMIEETLAALQSFDTNPDVGCLVLTGSDKAFAAGADIGFMAEASAMAMFEQAFLSRWDVLTTLQKPLIAAVSGYALGGGCEIALMCDMIIASGTATFGQPEINIGVFPGAGGTQRLTRLLGKGRALELILTGDTFTAQEALALGVVNHVYPVESYLQETLLLAEKIAHKPRLAVKMAKKCVQKALETSLSEGLDYERQLFYALFASQDQKEGMRAFLEKRAPHFTGG
jgi:enoyl-CoA hydratase